jgi:hypothetical protein
LRARGTLIPEAADRDQAEDQEVAAVPVVREDRDQVVEVRVQGAPAVARVLVEAITVGRAPAEITIPGQEMAVPAQAAKAIRNAPAKPSATAGHFR